MKGKIKLKIPWFLESEFDINTNKNIKKIAWELYCELTTRVGVVDFKEDEDIIIYCLDSWYKFFNFARQKIKELKIPKVDKKKSKKIDKKNPKMKNIYLVEVILSLLNEQLRPFLRKWHGIFRHYWNYDSDEKEYPIERQNKFKNYNEIIQDLLAMQKKLKETSEGLYEIAVS